MELGNILEPEKRGAKGPDLRYVVEVSKRHLGTSEGVAVEVPETIEHEGVQVARVRSPHDEHSSIKLQLPKTLPEGATIRLRGQGGVCEGGPPGDLYLEIKVKKGPDPRWLALVAAVLILLVLLIR